MEGQGGKLITNKISLPLFMVSRVRFKEPTNKEELKGYIHKNKLVYLSNGCEEDSSDNGSFNIRKYQHILAPNGTERRSYCPGQMKTVAVRSSCQEKSWQLAPNRYSLETRPFDSKSGLKGAYWRKLPETKSLKRIFRKPSYRLYDLPRETEKMGTRCQAQKGTFLSNPRERRATSRGMIANPLTAYKDPLEPAPNTYSPKEPGRIYEIPKPSRPLHPHVFYRKSIVPVRPNSIHPQHISFHPGPGRYETRYRNICPCSHKRIYHPELDLIIERQKRLKFRRKPYAKIKSHLYCSPDWRHVTGGGFQHLFMGGAGPQNRTVTAEDEAKGKSKLVKLFHDAKYMNMILHSSHDPGTFRQEPMPQLPTRITYNRMINVISRKHLRTNRKLAFGSSVERWKDEDRPPVLTTQQLKDMREKLPPERRICNQPVMEKRREEISSKLLETPAHMLPNYIPKLRKRLFKFLPLPGAKILTSDADIRPEEPAAHGYFLRPLNEKLFFKEIKN